MSERRQPDPDPVPSLVEIARLMLLFRFSAEELRQAGLDERDFKRMLARLRLVILNSGWVLED